MVTNPYSLTYAVCVGVAMLSGAGLMSCFSLLEDHPLPGSPANITA